MAITLPGQPTHGFSFDPNDRLQGYLPPDVTPALSLKDSSYSRDFDGLVLIVDHAGKVVSNTYDIVGRRSSSAVGGVSATYTYDSAGRLTTIATTDGVTLAYGYDGSLLTQQAVSGPFSRALSKTYDILMIRVVDCDRFLWTILPHYLANGRMI